MSYREAGGNNTYLPDYESSGNLMTEFSRNIKNFPINQFSEIRPVTRRKGFYLRLNPEQASRVLYEDEADAIWAPGADSPTGEDNLSQFEFEPFICQRKARAKLLENLAVQQSAWPVAEAELRALGQQCMTGIVRTGFLALRTASLPASNTSTATALIQTATGTSGQNWTNATALLPYIRTTLLAAAQQINLGTGGVITPKDLIAVISAADAPKLSTNPEILGALNGSFWAYGVVTGTLPGAPGTPNWTLPPQLGGFRVVVDDTTVTTSKKGASSVTQQYAQPSGTVYLLTRRENEMVNPTILRAEANELKLTDDERENIPIVSSLVRFMFEEFTTENNVDVWNRRTQSRIAYDYQWQVTNPLSMFKITNIFG